MEQRLRPGKPVMEMTGAVGLGGEAEEVSQSMEEELELKTLASRDQCPTAAFELSNDRAHFRARDIALRE